MPKVVIIIENPDEYDQSIIAGFRIKGYQVMSTEYDVYQATQESGTVYVTVVQAILPIDFFEKELGLRHSIAVRLIRYGNKISIAELLKMQYADILKIQSIGISFAKKIYEARNAYIQNHIIG